MPLRGRTAQQAVRVLSSHAGSMHVSNAHLLAFRANIRCSSSGLTMMQALLVAATSARVAMACFWWF